jgi:hypothetical protein
MRDEVEAVVDVAADCGTGADVVTAAGSLTTGAETGIEATTVHAETGSDGSNSAGVPITLGDALLLELTTVSVNFLAP